MFTLTKHQYQTLHPKLIALVAKLGDFDNGKRPWNTGEQYTVEENMGVENLLDHLQDEGFDRDERGFVVHMLIRGWMTEAFLAEIKERSEA